MLQLPHFAQPAAVQSLETTQQVASGPEAVQFIEAPGTSSASQHPMNCCGPPGSAAGRAVISAQAVLALHDCSFRPSHWFGVRG